MASIAPFAGNLDTRKSAHLLRRASMVYNRSKIDSLATMSVVNAVDSFVTAAPSLSMDEPIDPATGQPWLSTNATISNTLAARYIQGWWIHESLQDETINHKMMLFLHNTFTASYLKGGGTGRFNFFDHLSLLRHYSLGNFKTFAKKMTLDNMMLLYLDNNLNTGDAPNENYGREFLELFTMGKEPEIGTTDFPYAANDVEQAARVFSGFKISPRTAEYIDPDTGILAGRAIFSKHDAGDKTFSSSFGGVVIAGASNQADMFRELDDFVDMVFDQRVVAEFFCRRLYRFFVGHNITSEIESDILTPLADTFIANDFEMEPVIRQLLRSKHFYDQDDSNNSDEIIGGLIKSPLDLLCSAMSFFNVQLPDPQTDPSGHYNVFWSNFVCTVYFVANGYDLFAPNTVEGYPGYNQKPLFDKSWFISSTIVPRYKLGEMLVTGRRVLVAGTLGSTKLDSIAYFENIANISQPDQASVVVDDLADYLFPEKPNANRKAFLLDDIFLEGLNALNWQFEWANYINTNDDSDVRISADQLITVLLRTPEFQMF